MVCNKTTFPNDSTRPVNITLQILHTADATCHLGILVSDHAGFTNGFHNTIKQGIADPTLRTVLAGPTFSWWLTRVTMGVAQAIVSTFSTIRFGFGSCSFSMCGE